MTAQRALLDDVFAAVCDEGQAQTVDVAIGLGREIAEVAPALRALAKRGLIRQTNYELPSGVWAWEAVS